MFREVTFSPHSELSRSMVRVKGLKLLEEKQKYAKNIKFKVTHPIII